jgi:adenylyltransferase/sulfurtransferase
MTDVPDAFDRYHRQMLLPFVGAEGQARLRNARVLVVGCGALGTVIVDLLARAGVGALTIVDRDVVEITNLQRQVLFDEADVEAGVPKAIAAEAKIARVNSQVDVRARVDDFNHRTAEGFVEGADLIMDGLDNFETRYLLNDLAVRRGLPYVYGGAVSTTGVSLVVLPHSAARAEPSEGAVTWTDEQATPCLRCVFPEAPPPGTSPTCDTAGVLATVVTTIAAHQVTQALKLLTGNVDAVDRGLLSIDVWTNETRRFDVAGARDASDCPCCVGGEFPHLDGTGTSAATSLCGRNAVQIAPRSVSSLDLADVAERLAPHGGFSHNDFLLRGTFHAERADDGTPLELTLFPNGRAIIKGSQKLETARSIYAKYIGA